MSKFRLTSPPEYSPVWVYRYSTDGHVAARLSNELQAGGHKRPKARHLYGDRFWVVRGMDAARWLGLIVGMTADAEGPVLHGVKGYVLEGKRDVSSDAPMEFEPTPLYAPENDMHRTTVGLLALVATRAALHRSIEHDHNVETLVTMVNKGLTELRSPYTMPL